MSKIDELAAAYAAAVYAKDETALLDLYDPDVFIYDMWSNWSYKGREAWAGSVRDWFASLGDERVKVTFTPDHSVIDGEWATWSATVRYTAVSPADEELRFLENRNSWSLRQRNNRWLIVHEHSSAPADFKTLRVILRRP